MANPKERKPAPPVVVDEVFRDDRAAILEELNKNSPEFIHMFQRGGSNPDELSRKGMEVVKTEAGAEVMHESDIVVRQPRELFNRRKAAESAEAFRGGSRIVKDPDDIRQYRSPKKVKIRKEEEE